MRTRIFLTAVFERGISKKVKFILLLRSIRSIAIPSANQNVPLESYPKCTYYEGPVGSGETVNLTCDLLVSGRYLIIQLNTSKALSLCEVEVFGGKVLTCRKSNQAAMLAVKKLAGVPPELNLREH